ncbi:MAG: VOC family protein, partial [Rhodothermia bacterium]|nr:VOC family protein [Rhodothermia bacterium]
MRHGIAGIHHITGISGPAQENVDFYAGVLGLRLVKRTVNFDDPGTYHLYYGDYEGRPGSIMTFFPWTNARRGRPGSGMVGLTSFSVPASSLDYWVDRLVNVSSAEPKRVSMFGQDAIEFSDPDGLRLALVGSDEAGEASGSKSGESGVSLRGFHGATLL